MKTPMQQLIEFIEQLENSANENNKTIAEMQVERYSKQMRLKIKEYAESLTTKEMEEIKDAYDAGTWKNYKNSNEYYNKTYKTN